MSSAKIWHVCDGAQQMERVESLNGTAKSTFRRNEQVVTFYPDTKVAIAENREFLGAFPNLLKSTQTALEDSYQMRSLAGDRVVGLDTDVVQLKPKDTARFGCRVECPELHKTTAQEQGWVLHGDVVIVHRAL